MRNYYSLIGISQNPQFERHGVTTTIISKPDNDMKNLTAKYTMVVVPLLCSRVRLPIKVVTT